MGKVYIVTGGSGFIGTNFIRFMLDNGFAERIINLDKLTYAGNPQNLLEYDNDKRYAFAQGDICDQELVQELFILHKPDVVVNFAAESHVDRSIDGPSDFIRTNISGTYTLLQKSLRYYQSLTKEDQKSFRFHHVSTDEVYGSLGDTGLFLETTSYDPQSPYSSSKASSDHFVRAYGNTYGMPFVISNCSNNYGPNQFPEKLLPLFINNIRNGKALPVYGDGKFTRDWLYVVDHAIAIDKIYHEGRNGETYNIGGFNEWTNIDLIKVLCKQMDIALGNDAGTAENLITYVKDRPGHDKRYAIDANKLKNELGWEPSLQFEEGLVKTIAWYLGNKEWMDNITSGDYQNYYKQQYS